MQKTLIGILTTLTLVLGVVCVRQSGQLRASREQVRATEEARATETEAREAQVSRMKNLERSNERLEQQVQQFASVTTTLRSNDVRQSSNLTALAQQLRPPFPGGAGAAGEGGGESGQLGKGVGEMLGKMMKDPAMREMMRDQQKAVIKLMYAGLFKDLNLTPEEKDKLQGIFTESQMQNVEAAQGMFGGEKEGAAEEATRQITEGKKQTEAEVRALLGEERYAQYEDYQKNMAERMQLDQFKNQLAGDSPLRDEQMKQLLQLMQAEKAARPPAIPTDQTQVPRKEMFTAENLDKQMKWMEDYNRRVLEGAGKILSPEQLQQYQAFQEQQAAMQKLGLQMTRGMFGGDKAGGTPLAVPAR